MLISYKRSQTSIILRVKIRDSAQTDGRGKTGLTNSSTGMIISTIADNEASATVYSVASSNVETIATLGTFAAPTSGKCRFKEVDATNHKGVYELQIADARFAVSNAKSLLVSISGASGACECDALIPLTDLDPYNSVRAGLTALPNAAAEAAGGLITAGSGTNQLTVAGGRAQADVKRINDVANAAANLAYMMDALPLYLVNSATDGSEFQLASIGDLGAAKFLHQGLLCVNSVAGSGLNKGKTVFITGYSWTGTNVELTVDPPFPETPGATDAMLLIGGILPAS